MYSVHPTPNLRQTFVEPSFNPIVYWGLSVVHRRIDGGICSTNLRLPLINKNQQFSWNSDNLAGAPCMSHTGRLPRVVLPAPSALLARLIGHIIAMTEQHSSVGWTLYDSFGHTARKSRPYYSNALPSMVIYVGHTVPLLRQCCPVFRQYWSKQPDILPGKTG